MGKRFAKTKPPDVQLKEIRVRLPKHLYFSAKAICVLKDIRLSDVIAANLARWVKSSDKQISRRMDGPFKE